MIYFFHRITDMALTKHEEGSLREIWSISLPLMLTSLSIMSMLFVDRILLARYSLTAFNAAVNSATLGWAFVIGWLTLASIAEVFVAQYNGSEQKKKLGEPVWQMIWLSFGSFLFFFPLAFFGNELIFGSGSVKSLEKEYFFWMMIFGPSFALSGAISAFFVGQGKIQLVSWLSLGANIVNAILDCILIFGIEGWVPSLGIKGAAIATCGSTIFQVIVLGGVFLNSQNRLEFGTGNWKFNAKSFYQCLRIGFPNALFVSIEILGWAAFYWMMTLVSERHITVAGICQSVALLLFFFADGVNKAVTTIAGNMIGAGKGRLIPKVLKSGLWFHIYFFLLVTVFFIFFTNFIILQFLPNASEQTLHALHDTLITCLIFILFYILFDGLRLLVAGALTAAGDTVFLFVAGSLSVWILLVLPVYFVVVRGGAAVEYGSFFCALYALCATLIYYLRFAEGKWKSISIIA
jgi:multidrug resistance protein, MATE family